MDSLTTASSHGSLVSIAILTATPQDATALGNAFTSSKKVFDTPTGGQSPVAFCNNWCVTKLLCAQTFLIRACTSNTMHTHCLLDPISCTRPSLGRCAGAGDIAPGLTMAEPGSGVSCNFGTIGNVDILRWQFADPFDIRTPPHTQSVCASQQDINAQRGKAAFDVEARMLGFSSQNIVRGPAFQRCCYPKVSGHTTARIQ